MSRTLRAAAAADSETGRYLGYPTVTTDRSVSVFRQDGKLLATLPSHKAARAFIRGYRGGKR